MSNDLFILNPTLDLQRNLATNPALKEFLIKTDGLIFLPQSVEIYKNNTYLTVQKNN